MFIIKVMYVNLCVFSVRCEFEDRSYEDEEGDTKEINYFKYHFISKEQSSYSNRHTTKSGKLYSTIEPSVSKYQESKTPEDGAEYKSTLIDYPYVASIQRQGSHYATGALVDKRWVLSVAGDFYNVRESIKLFRVRLGSVDCKRGGSVFPINVIRIHPSYVHGKPGFDLAMIRLAVPVVTSCAMRPVSLPITKNELSVGNRVTTAYWPRIIVNGSMLPVSAKERVKFTSMRTSKQIRIPSSKCEKMMRGFQVDLKFSVCLKPLVTFHSVCMPDAGAPVVAKDGLLGITSGWVSPRCPTSPGPTLVTRVISSVRRWIETQLQPSYTAKHYRSKN